MAMQISPLAGALGAEILGVDLRNLDDNGWKDIHKAFLQYSVLAIRGQTLEPADIMKVGARFGEPCHYPFVTGMEGFPYIFEVVKEPEEKRNFGGAWHSDTAYLKQPPLATLLYAIETPSHGGDTLFANTSAAYDALSEGMRKVVDTLVGVNCAELKHAGGRTAQHNKIKGMKIHDTESAGEYLSEHLLARTHPETGRKALYASRSHTTRIKGMTEEESAPLLNFLFQHQVRPEFTCRVRWAPGTLTVWDNRCTQHNAVNDYHGQRRRMRRLTVGAQTPE
jgi:taurine dioxygenase